MSVEAYSLMWLTIFVVVIVGITLGLWHWRFNTDPKPHPKQVKLPSVLLQGKARDLQVGDEARLFCSTGMLVDSRGYCWINLEADVITYKDELLVKRTEEGFSVKVENTKAKWSPKEVGVIRVSYKCSPVISLQLPQEIA